MREQILEWANSRINKGPNFDDNDVLIIKKYIKNVKNVDLDPNIIIQSMYSRQRELVYLLSNMLNHMCQKYIILEVRDKNNLLIKFA